MLACTQFPIIADENLLDVIAKEGTDVLSRRAVGVQGSHQVADIGSRISDVLKQVARLIRCLPKYVTAPLCLWQLP